MELEMRKGAMSLVFVTALVIAVFAAIDFFVIFLFRFM